jgi:hypothetical protein
MSSLKFSGHGTLPTYTVPSDPDKNLREFCQVKFVSINESCHIRCCFVFLYSLGLEHVVSVDRVHSSV